MAPAKKPAVSTTKRKATDALTSSTSKKSCPRLKPTPISVSQSQTEKTIPMAVTAKQAHAGQKDVIMDSDDDTDGEGNRAGHVNTAVDSSQLAASKMSNIKEVINNTINSKDELGEQACTQSHCHK